MKVAIIEGKRPTLMPEGPEIELGIFGPDVEIKWYGSLGQEGYKQALEEVDAVITRPGAPFSKEMVRALKKARVIVSLGAGYEHIDFEEAAHRRIPVCNVPDYGTEEVADSALAMLLAHHRKIFLYKHKVSGRVFDWDWRINKPIARTRHTMVGIIGLGRIGTAVSLRLKGFGYRIAFYDPYLGRGIEKSLGLTRFNELKELIAISDIVTLHTPLTAETTGMVNETFLEALKPQAILINTARGGLFKSADLIYDCLRTRQALRIGSDVWSDEPPEEHPLLAAWRDNEPWLGDRLILTPHSAFYSEEAVREIRSFAAEIVKVVLNGGKPYNVVNGMVR